MTDTCSSLLLECRLSSRMALNPRSRARKLSVGVPIWKSGGIRSIPYCTPASMSKHTISAIELVDPGVPEAKRYSGTKKCRSGGFSAQLE